ncbi:MAG: hypothetical protein PVJ84_11215, partial [Desulfobacteraceae bacterium]
MKKILLIFGLCFLITSGPALAAFNEPYMAQYTAFPIFSAQSVKPNIMVVLDNSGSMNEPAYTDTFSGAPYFSTEYPLINALDDMEGSGAPNVSPDNQLWDLDMGERIVGLRFQDVNVDQGAVITSAYIEFVAVDSDSKTTNLTIQGEANDNAAPFTSASPVTSRTGTTSTVAWNSIPAWTRGDTYNSPDISSIVQEIVDRDGWSNGNAMVFRITGSGERDAYSRDKSSTLMPILHIVTADQGKTYYGYFNPDYFYEYDSGIFTPAYQKESYGANSWTVRAFDSDTETLSTSTTSLSAASIEAGLWDGNWLNWLCMRRVDVLRKVMVGGLSNTRHNGGKQSVEGEDPDSGTWYEYWSKTMDTTDNMPVGPYHGNYTYTIENGNFSVGSDTYDSDDKNEKNDKNDKNDKNEPNENDDSSVGGNTYDIKVRKEPAIESQDFDDSGQELVGVLQRVGTQARWGNT